MKKLYRQIRKMFQNFKILIKFLYYERETRYRSNVAKSAWVLLRGFNTDKYIAYNLKENNYKDYLSDYERRKAVFLNGKYRLILDNKILFYNVFSSIFHIPTNYAIISDGQIKSLSEDSPIYNSKSFMDYLHESGAVVVKPIDSGGGKNVLIVKKSNGNYYLNNECVTVDEIIGIINKLDNNIITEFIIQSEFSQSLYSKSTNTIRLLLYRNIDTGRMELVAAAQRIGSSLTGGLDNASAGGVSAQININTGIIEKSISIENRDGIKIVRDYHPETRLKLKGLKIPSWEIMIADICKKLDLFPYINYIGLDVVLTDKGYSVIEGNSYPGARVHQLHEPLLINKDFKKMLRAYNIIRK